MLAHFDPLSLQLPTESCNVSTTHFSIVPAHRFSNARIRLAQPLLKLLPEPQIPAEYLVSTRVKTT